MLPARLSAPLLIGTLLAGSAIAQDRPALEPLPAPPPLPERVRSGQVLEPEVTIIQRKEETIHEYRLNGELLAVKVEPKVGPAYYLIDTDGDGSLETRSNEFEPDLLIQGWVLLRW